MGANQQTSVPAFTAGQVLTAQQQTEINTGVPVFADSTARDAAFGGTGEKVLAEGQLAYLEDSNIVQYYDGSVWATVGPTPAPGLELVKTQTIGTTVSSVTVSDAFSATYDNYYITVSGGVASTALRLTLAFGATTTGYYYGVTGINYGTGNANSANGNNAASFDYAGVGSTNSLFMSINAFAPNLAKNTMISGIYGQNGTTSASQSIGGFLNNSTQYTSFVIATSSGTVTGGEIRVYGYKN